MQRHNWGGGGTERGVSVRREYARRARRLSLAIERLALWAARPDTFRRSTLAKSAAHYPHVWHSQHVPLRRSDPHAHRVFEAGKVVNVALVATRLDGLALDPGEPFSFWRAVGRLRAADGFRHGMELRGGCVVPALGGGVCLLTNGLFRAAAELGWTIIERHGHTLEAVHPPAGELWGLDATVSWPAFDLRFAPRPGDPPTRLEVRVVGDTLAIEVRAAGPLARTVHLESSGNRIDVVDGQRVRHNTIVRRVVEVPGGPERSDVVATNAKRLLHDAELGRSCLTCGLTSCVGRVDVPAGELNLIDR